MSSELTETIPPEKKDLDWAVLAQKANVVMAVTAVITVIVVGATFFYDRFGEAAKQRRDQQINWQYMCVMRIVGSAGTRGIAFEDIRDAYLAHAQQEGKVPLEQADLGDDVLEETLADLEFSNLIYAQSDGKFIRNYCIANPHAEDEVVSRAVRYRILKFLASDSGKYTIQQLLQKLDVSSREAGLIEAVANAMCGCGELVVDKEGFVSSRVRWLAQKADSSRESK
jgi:hypothetical protein